jgi:hypothetical protein
MSVCCSTARWPGSQSTSGRRVGQRRTQAPAHSRPAWHTRWPAAPPVATTRARSRAATALTPRAQSHQPPRRLPPIQESLSSSSHPPDGGCSSKTVPLSASRDTSAFQALALVEVATDAFGARSNAICGGQWTRGRRGRKGGKRQDGHQSIADHG